MSYQNLNVSKQIKTKSLSQHLIKRVIQFEIFYSIMNNKSNDLNTDNQDLGKENFQFKSKLESVSIFIWYCFEQQGRRI